MSKVLRALSSSGMFGSLSIWSSAVAIVFNPSFELLGLVLNYFAIRGFQWGTFGWSWTYSVLNAFKHGSDIASFRGNLDGGAKIQPQFVGTPNALFHSVTPGQP